MKRFLARFLVTFSMIAFVAVIWSIFTADLDVLTWILIGGAVGSFILALFARKDDRR